MNFMKVKVLLFASLKQGLGKSQLNLEVEPGITVADFKQMLGFQFPEHRQLITSALVSINRDFALNTDILPEDAEVGLFPPVSGGSELLTDCRITDEAIDLNTLTAELTTTTTGAVCIFTGMVRGKTIRGEARETILLEYEAYIPMAEKKMYQVAGEIRKQWPEIEGIIIIQRIGRLQAGTPTVLIACSASHRDTGVFEAARYGIDRLKEIVPVWKKEVGPLGEVWIEGEYVPKAGD
ncbi:MAG: molybdenum cofactor biosynthesis protein MoaE [Anaerolineaceae bacterium]|nr:molybdenum cofactor biosynthesis protein MoaE [Anaerolineaceae bacterium]